MNLQTIMRTVIQTEGLGKRYRRGALEEADERLRHVVQRFVKSPLAPMKRIE